jgi:hypothetical protein
MQRKGCEIFAGGETSQLDGPSLERLTKAVNEGGSSIPALQEKIL